MKIEISAEELKDIRNDYRNMVYNVFKLTDDVKYLREQLEKQHKEIVELKKTKNVKK